ncbi:MAG: 2-enoyl thioester reductase domain-containing protein [Candidatus Poribacteria bacterium]|nr:2-enoyl thioester reductase domain-containing protein [Candidatus Poribacteria bacterium]
MKKTVTVACHHEYGIPEDVVRVEDWELPTLAPNQVLVEMKAAPINPADINVLEGKYPIRSPLPEVPGNEGVGVIAQTGSAVSNLQVGRHVIVPDRVGSWCQAYVADADNLIPLPDNLPLEQAALLSINAATAWRLLEDFVNLSPGDWMIQNVANSAVGRFVLQIARFRGLKTVNVVRRQELISELQAEGADVVVTDEMPLSKQIRDLMDGADAKLGLNAVGGASASEIAKSLGDHGTLVTYGAMGLQPLQMGNGLLIFKDLRFRGFWINDWYKRAGNAAIREMFDQLSALVAAGKLKAPIEQTYPLADARSAVIHARRSHRKGKILFVMNEAQIKQEARDATH